MAVDVALPSGAPIGELLPAVVDMVLGGATSDSAALWWRLDRPGGGTLDESLSLQDNDVHDGELLALSRVDEPALGAIGIAPVRAALDTPTPGGRFAPFLPGTAGVVAVAVASAALASTSGSGSATANAIVAAVSACAAAAVTVTTGYATTSALALVCLAIATGFLAVPSAPAAPNVFLAAAAGLTTSVVILRLSGRISSTFVGCAAISLLTAVVTMAALPVVVIGAVLSCASLAMLTAAPRLSLLATRFEPGSHDGTASDRAADAHAALDGLVFAGGAGVASGAITVAAAPTMRAPAGLAFTAVLAVVLLLRARSHADVVRRIPLLMAGFACVVTSLWLALDACPSYVGAAGGILAGLGLLTIRVPPIGAPAARALDRLEYVALAAVVPAACWVGGAYALLGGSP